MPINEEHYVDLRGKRHVLYSGLLAAAHELGLTSIDEEIIQIPTAENGNAAICKATVLLHDGRRFQGIGDASPENVSRNIAPHALRMASTRAKARALRDAVNIGVSALEETGGEEEPSGRGQGPQRQSSQASEGAERTPGGATKRATGYLQKLLIEQGHDEEKVKERVPQMSASEVSEKIKQYKPQEGAS